MDVQIKGIDELSFGDDFVPGFYFIADDKYHSSLFDEFISSHGIMEILKSAAHFQEFLKEDRTPTESMRFGSAAHRAVFYPDYSGIGISTARSYRTKEFAADEMALLKDGANDVVVIKDDIDRIKKMRDVLMRHSLSRQAIINGIAETSGLWTRTDYQGVRSKMKIDYLLPDVNVIVEYKTAADARPDKFTKAAIDYGYDVQTAYYIDGMKFLSGEDWKFIFIVQEKEPPFAVNYFIASKEFIDLGMKKVRVGLKRYFECLEKKDFSHGYVEQFIDLIPPTWALNQVVG